MFLVGWLFLNAGTLKWNGFFWKVVSSLKLEICQQYLDVLFPVSVGETIQASNQMSGCIHWSLNSLPTRRCYDSSIYPKCP